MGKSAKKNPPGKSPGKSSKFYTTKILQHISADWPGQDFLVLPAHPSIQGRYTGVFQTGGASRSGLVLPFCPFWDFSRFFWDFPDLLGDGPGIFLICPFPLSLSRPIKSTYEEQSRKGPRHNLDLSQTWETPRFGLAPLNSREKLYTPTPPPRPSVLPEAIFIECFRGRRRGGRNFTSFLRFSGPFLRAAE